MPAARSSRALARRCAQRAQIKGAAPPHYRVDDGTRTHDTRNHNPMLYQLNYIHRVNNPSFRNGLQIYKLILICKSIIDVSRLKSAHRRYRLFDCKSKRDAETDIGNH